MAYTRILVDFIDNPCS